MGLDAVEIVLRTEDLFAITLPDDEAATIRTVADLYVLACSKLHLTPLPSPQTSAQLPTISHTQKTFLVFEKRHPLPAPPELLPWSPQTVWDALVAILVDQQQLKASEILPHSPACRKTSASTEPLSSLADGPSINHLGYPFPYAPSADG